MSANAGVHDSHKANFEMVKKLLDVGEGIKKILTGKSELSINLDIGFLKNFGEVISAVGLHLKNDDAEQTLKELLAPLSSYTSLMPHFLLIKSILGNVQSVIEVDLKEHKDRLECINKELTRIAVKATLIAQKLEDLGNSLIDILKGEYSKKAANLKIFDIHYNKVSLTLESCISDMGLVKRKIDEGLQSIEEYKDKITSKNNVGIFNAVFSLISSAVSAFINWITRNGNHHTSDMELKKANKIQECYNEQHFHWEKLDKTLKTMTEELNLHRKTRITA